MKLRTLFTYSTIAALAALSFFAAGCAPDTEVSRVPSKAEIEEGQARRLAAIDALQIPEEQKQRMRQQITGSAPPKDAPPKDASAASGNK